jgi:hypothetical protein
MLGPAAIIIEEFKSTMKTPQPLKNRVIRHAILKESIGRNVLLNRQA